MKKIFYTTLSFIFFLPTLVFGFTEYSLGGNIAVDVSPKNPAPGQTVSLRLISYENDLNSSNILWTINDEIVDEGVGRTSLQFTMGSFGETKTVKAAIKSLSGKNMGKIIIFQANDVDILWQAETYTPPFYQGYAEPGFGSNLKLLAIPHIKDSMGNSITKDKLIFNWQKDGKNLPLSSGTGKDSVNIKSDNITALNTIKLDIYSLSGEHKASKTINITSQKPELVFYRHDPLLGVQYEKALVGTIDITDPEITIKAEPLFFDKNAESNNGLSFGWLMNGKSASANSNDASYITFRTPPGERGESEIAISVKNPNILFQTASAILKLQFGGGPGLFQ